MLTGNNFLFAFDNDFIVRLFSIFFKAFDNGFKAALKLNLKPFLKLFLIPIGFLIQIISSSLNRNCSYLLYRINLQEQDKIILYEYVKI